MAKELSVSVIIPTKNRPADLILAVTSILKQKKAPNELIIVDQSDINESYDVVKSLFSTYRMVPKLLYVYEPGICGLVEAKQKGVSVSKCEIISFLEDDIVLHHHYIENVFELFEKKVNIMGCCGVMSNQHSGYIYETLFALFHRGIFFDARLNAGKSKDCGGDGVLIPSRFLSGGISSYRRLVFDDVEFDTKNDFHMLEDIDFSTRAVDFFGEDFFFIASNMCLEHNMSEINRDRLRSRWQRKLIEYAVFYKKNSYKRSSLINFIWLLIGLFWESVASSLLKRNVGPLLGTIVGLYVGIRKKLVS